MKIKQQVKHNSTFPIVGIGASAGGLKAFTQLLEAIPPDIDMAFVLVQHLDPTTKSLLSETLARTTPLPFIKVIDGIKITKNHVYVMPSESYMTIVNHTLHLTPRKKRNSIHKPIDAFFQSLAKHHGKDAIGVLLSGMGNDGTEGLRTIKESGGRTFAQDDSAQFKNMPQSAIDSGSVDFILSSLEIAHTLFQISREITSGNHKSKPEGDPTIDAILAILHADSGMDFRQYKQTTVNRRIQRRMLLNHIKTVKDYAEFFNNNPKEAEALQKDMLIHVTSFFREPEQFEALKTLVFPALAKGRSSKKPINVWIPGCATGEEAYSFAILFKELFGKKTHRIPVKIFATDIAKDVIAQAKRGVYEEDITKHVSPIRIRQFFTKVTGGYKVKKSIRDMCEFAVADVTQKPSQLDNDLVSCRNLLIYLGDSLQQKTLFILSSTLKPGGFLLLGKSEGLGASAKLFSPLDSKQKTYSKNASTSATHDLRKTINTQVGMSTTPLSTHTATIPQPVDFNNTARQQKIIKLKEAVTLTQEYANEIISELDTMNEELQSANEELTISNEELQTTNEELETLEEELQTANEEMTTLNDELQARNEEVTRALDYADAIIKTVPESLVVLDSNLRVKSANESFYKIFNVKPKDTADRVIYDLGNKQWDIPKLRTLLEKIITQKNTLEDFVVEHDFETIGQRTMLLNARLLLQGPNKNPLILLFMVDITEQKKGEEALKQSEKRLRFMAESMPQKIFTADSKGNIDYFNPVWMEYTGLLFEQIRDWGWAQVIHPNDVKENIRVWKHSIDTGEPFELEHRFRRADGQYHWHLSRALPMRDAKGNIIKWFGSNTDIDDQKAAVEQKDEFISIASHELKTPVTTIKGYADILAKLFQNTNQVQPLNYLSKMDFQINRLISLVNELLDVSRIQSGKLQLDKDVILIDEIVKDVIEDMQHTSETHQIIFENNANNHQILVDKYRITQVLINLISNAIKYSPESDKVIIKISINNKNLIVSVKDFGIGISKRDQPKVFDRFFQAKTRIRESAFGLGLGLYISSEIIKAHEGKIWIESVKGEGSTFSFSLPLSLPRR